AVPRDLPSFPTRRSSDLGLDDGAPGAQRPVEAHPGVAREDLADRFAGRYLETGSDSTALAGSLAGGGERSEHPTSVGGKRAGRTDRKSTRLNSSHDQISY